MEVDFFPSCPFKSMTGLACPGCGSQRALHHLLNFELGSAFQKNALLVLSIPYILLGFIFDQQKQPAKKQLVWRKRLYGKTAIWIVLAVVILFWILRNLVQFL